MNAELASSRSARVVLRMIDWYQRGVEGRPSPCRFTPGCSEYARESIERYGTGRGGWLAVRRLSRCRPFGPSGYDPVPDCDHDHSISTPTAHHSKVT